MADQPGGQLQHRGRRAVQRLVEFAPASGGLALWVRHADVDAAAGPAPGTPVFTDGTTVHYAPAFERLSLDEQTGWVAHQVLHIALRHAQRFNALQRRLGEADLALFNRCADAIVNSTLAPVSWIALPADALTLDVLLDQVLNNQRSAESALLEWDVERLYAACDDRRKGGDKGRKDGPKAARLRALGAGHSADLRPTPDSGEQAIAEAEEAREWADRLLRGHAGDGAFSILRALGADLPRVHTPWEQLLRTQATRALSQRPGLSWSRPTRSWLASQGRVGTHGRKPWEPGTTASRSVPRLVLVLDVSGSIDDALLDRFAAELNVLTRRLEAPMTLVIGDDQVRETRQFAPGRASLQGIAFDGGGGTDFTPLLEEASRHRPDLTVVLTDLQGPALHRPRGALLWAVPVAFADAVVPFGRKLVLR